MELTLTALPLSQALRYLGCGPGQLEGELARKLQLASQALLAAARPRWHAAEFETSALLGQGLLPGRDIAAHLEGCPRCLLFGATLGSEADRLLRLTQLTDMAQAVLLDGCASAAIEEVCDQAQALLEQRYLERDLGLTSRFSPGYGDLPLEVQAPFLERLDARRRIGLAVNAGGMLTPTKSVTAVIGLLPQGVPRPQQPGPCRLCPRRQSCQLRRKGVFCGKTKQ